MGGFFPPNVHESQVFLFSTCLAALFSPSLVKYFQHVSSALLLTFFILTLFSHKIRFAVHPGLLQVHISTYLTHKCMSVSWQQISLHLEMFTFYSQFEQFATNTYKIVTYVCISHAEFNYFI